MNKISCEMKMNSQLVDMCLFMKRIVGKVKSNNIMRSFKEGSNFRFSRGKITDRALYFNPKLEDYLRSKFSYAPLLVQPLTIEVDLAVSEPSFFGFINFRTIIIVDNKTYKSRV